MWEMIKQEFKNIYHNKILLVSTLVICVIPFLYSIFFLKSVWDPYGNTQDLPVAVVNKDIPVEYQGRKMDVGDQTIKNLRTNHALKWEFVSAKKAQEGLKGRKYYTVVTIPKDFSRNATTVMDKHPKTMKLKYETNDSLNMIGEVISQMGMQKLNTKIRASVTNAYASAMFEELHVVGHGMSKAADGAKQLDAGIVTLNNGANQYVAGVGQVNKGVQEMRVKVAPLTAGAAQLASGSQTLANGIQQFTGGVGMLGTGVSQLVANSGALNSGAGQLQAGIGQFAGGINQLNAGLGLLDRNSAALNSGANQLKEASGKFVSLNNGMQQMNAGVKQVGQMTNVIQGSSLMSTLGEAQSLGSQVSSLQSSLNDVEGTMQALNGVDSSKLAASINGIKGAATTAQSGLTSSLGTIAHNSANTAAQAQAIAAAVNADPHADQATKDKVNAAVKSIGSDQSSNGQALNQAKNSVSGLQNSLNDAQSSLGPTIQTLQGLQGKIPALSNDLNNAKAVLNQTQGLMNDLNKPENKAALNAISQMPQMSAKVKEMTDGAQALANGTQQLAAQTSSINQLANGINQYTAGVHTAAAGAGMLAANTGALQSGANQLANGVNQFTAGVGQLGNGISQLNANSGRLNAGAMQLAGALGQLNNQIPTLVAGVNQLAAGTQQLQDNSPALLAGIAKLNAGAGKLASSLGKGAKTINGIKPTARTAKMFAEPTQLQHKNYSYVPNYGHALAPYVLSVALYVGMLVFNFVYPIRRIAAPGKSATAWWVSKVVIGSTVAAAMAIVEDAIMIACGLTVDHAPSFFLTTICFGLASMAIVMFLSMTFDNPGRFLAMVLLMLQLGGSGGTFPMEVTMKFYNVIHWFLPMTYSIQGLRQSISSGLGQHYAMFCNSVLLGIAVVFFLLLWAAMIGIRSHTFNLFPRLDKDQKFLDKMENDGGIQSDRDNK